jgi:hypothetical protein
MDDLLKYVTIVKMIQTSASEIIKKLDPVLKTLDQPNNKILTAAMEKYPDFKDKLPIALKAQVSEWLNDATTVLHELDLFIVYNDTGFSFNFEGCPFLSEVWNGDTYDHQGIDGFVKLDEDLKNQFKLANREKLFETVIKKIKETRD